MSTVRIQDIKVGDSIMEGRTGGIEVTHLDFLSCSSRGVHVNGNACYEWGAVVRVENKKLEQESEDEDQQAPVEKALKARKRRLAREIAYA